MKLLYRSEICFRLSGFYGSPFWGELNGIVWNKSARAPTSIHSGCVCLFSKLSISTERVQDAADDDEVLFLEIQWNGKEFTWYSRSCNGFHWRSGLIHICIANWRPVYSAGELWPSHSFAFGSGSGKLPTDLPGAYSAHHRTLISRNCCNIRHSEVVCCDDDGRREQDVSEFVLWNIRLLTIEYAFSVKE